MRSRLAIVLAVVALMAALAPTPASAREGAVLAQTDLTGQEEEAEGQESQGDEGSEAETGASGEAEEGASTETGPPWTYQMARISVVLLVALALGVALMYMRLVAKRQRGAV